MTYTDFKSAFGWGGVAVSEQGIARIVFGAPTAIAAVDCLFHGMETLRGLASTDLGISKAAELLQQYFDGEPVDFLALDLDLEAGTTFQRSVWKITRRIPYGEIRSYGWIARAISKPKSARAVGRALGANPLPIIVPCHRILCSNGGLGGYSGGLDWKMKLLALENPSYFDSQSASKHGRVCKIP